VSPLGSMPTLAQCRRGGQSAWPALSPASGISTAFGGLHSMAGSLLWYRTLLTGFLILYSTQLGIMDLLPRTVTNMLWTSNPGGRRWANGDVRKVYYSTLVAFVVWAASPSTSPSPSS